MDEPNPPQKTQPQSEKESPKEKTFLDLSPETRQQVRDQAQRIIKEQEQKNGKAGRKKPQ